MYYIYRKKQYLQKTINIYNSFNIYGTKILWAESPTI